MSEPDTTTEEPWDEQVRARTSRLNANGAHYLIGWLVSAGFQRTEVMAELDWLMDDMETSPEFQHCWMREAELGEVAAICDEASAVMEKQKQENEPCVLELLPRPAAEDPAAAGSGNDAPAFAPRPGLLAHIMESLRKTFNRKPRMAA